MKDKEKGGFRRKRLVAFGGDAISQQVVGEVISSGVSFEGNGYPGGAADAIAWLRRDGVRPDILVVDLSGSEHPLDDAATLREICGPTTQIIAIGATNDVNLYRGLLGLSYSDYLIKPVQAETMLAAITGRSSQGSSKNRAVAVIGARGGVGSSMIAINCAWISAEERGRKVALVDLDLSFGVSLLTLDLAPSRGLGTALADPDRIDHVFLASALVSTGNRLSVFAAEEALDAEISVASDGIGQLQRELLKTNEWVWMDIPRYMLTNHTPVLDFVSHVVLVTDLSLAGMRDVMRLAGLVSQRQTPPQIHLVINKFRGHEAVKVEEFEKAVQISAGYILPENWNATFESHSTGKPLPLVAPRSNLVAVLNRIVTDILGVHGESEADHGLKIGGFWKKILPS